MKKVAAIWDCKEAKELSRNVAFMSSPLPPPSPNSFHTDINAAHCHVRSSHQFPSRNHHHRHLLDSVNSGQTGKLTTSDEYKTTNFYLTSHSILSHSLLVACGMNCTTTSALCGYPLSKAAYGSVSAGREGHFSRPAETDPYGKLTKI